ncbi:MAG: sigma-70 family RNA polymerase sigma factor [Geodermatophilaceae bacterium]|nr:sigma-70 family RNA polymerase sigma factor [Geodermatophilaceae bacterium]
MHLLADLDDAELLAAVADADVSALRVLYDRHAPWLILRLSRRCSDPMVVEEAVQDTFTAVRRSAGRWSEQGQVGAWIWGIAIRRLVDLLRSRRTYADLVADPPDRAVASVEDQVLTGIQYGDLAGALNRLSPELRAVLQATVLDGMTTREAGRLLGIPHGTVKTRLMRARLTLREELS